MIAVLVIGVRWQGDDESCSHLKSQQKLVWEDEQLCLKDTASLMAQKQSVRKRRGRWVQNHTSEELVGLVLSLFVLISFPGFSGRAYGIYKCCWHSDDGKIPLFLTALSWDHKVAWKRTIKDQSRSSCLSYTPFKCAPPKNPRPFPVLSPALVLLGCSGLVYLEIVFVSC